MSKFKPYNQKDSRMLIIEPDKLLEEEHPARIIDGIIEKYIDMSGIYANYSDTGRPAYHPKLMLKVLLYSYTEGVLSCRNMYKNVKYRADYKYLTGGDIPDFRTLNIFRRKNLKVLPKIFTQVVCLCDELDMIDFDNLAIDGQKIQANANYRKSYTKESLEKRYEKIKKGLEKLLSKDLEEMDKKYQEKHKERITKLEKEKKKIEDLKEVFDEIEEDDDNNDKNKRINMTDKDAKVMTHKDRTKKPSYNHLSAVDGKYGVTCAVKTKDTIDDSYDLLDMLERAKANLKKDFNKVLADSAYIRDELYPELEQREEEFYIPDTFKKRSEKNKYDKSNFKMINKKYLKCPEGKKLKREGNSRIRGIKYTRYKGINCKDCKNKEKCTNGKNRYVYLSNYDKAKTKMRKKLNSLEGKEIYMKRQGIVESSNGNDQKNIGWKQHLLRSLFKAAKEFILIRTGSNLKKIIKYKPRECLNLLGV